jgi:hypothetical protein
MVYKGRVVFTIVTALMLVLVLANVLLSLGNQSLRVEVNERQQFITQGMQLEGLHREIVTVLASIAVKNNDEQLKSLLASQGISFGANPGRGGSSK